MILNKDFSNFFQDLDPHTDWEYDFIPKNNPTHHAYPKSKQKRRIGAKKSCCINKKYLDIIRYFCHISLNHLLLRLISTLLKLEISTLLKTITNSCFQALEGLKFQALEGLKFQDKQTQKQMIRPYGTENNKIKIFLTFHKK